MCTGMQISNSYGNWLGRTMDMEHDIPCQICYHPVDYPVAENAEGGAFTQLYPTIGITFYGMDPLKDGINTHGLAGITNEFFGYDLFTKEPKPGKKNMCSHHFMSYVLANYRNIAELLEDLPNIHLCVYNQKGEKMKSPAFHYYFVDKTGRGVVLEPKGGQLVVFENPYHILTNAPAFPKQIAHLKSSLPLDDLNQFNSGKKLPGGYDPKSRFVRAYYLLKTQVDAKDAKQSLGYLFRLLGAMALPKGFFHNHQYNAYTHTLYLAVYACEETALYFQVADSLVPYRWAFADIIDPAKKEMYDMSNTYTVMKWSG